MRAWLKQRSEIDELSQQISEREAAVAELEQTKRRWHDDEYIKDQAKLRFAWVMPGETGYRVIGSDGAIVSDGSSELTDPTAEVRVDDAEWWDTAWSSVVEAGDEPASRTPDEERVREPADKIGGTSHRKPGAR